MLFRSRKISASDVSYSSRNTKRHLRGWYLLLLLRFAFFTFTPGLGILKISHSRCLYGISLLLFLWSRWQSRLFYMHDRPGLYDLKWKVPVPVWLHRSHRLLCSLRMGTFRGVPLLLCKQSEGCDIQHVHYKTRVPQGFGNQRDCRILQSFNKEINILFFFFFNRCISILYSTYLIPN